MNGLALSTETLNVVNNTRILLNISQRETDMTRGKRVGVVIGKSRKELCAVVMRREMVDLELLNVLSGANRVRASLLDVHLLSVIARRATCHWRQGMRYTTTARNEQILTLR